MSYAGIDTFMECSPGRRLAEAPAASWPDDYQPDHSDILHADPAWPCPLHGPDPRHREPRPASAARERRYVVRKAWLRAQMIDAIKAERN